MLRLLIGKAGSGKTGTVISEISDCVHGEIGPNILIVPEQYSHEAERELCRACGDSMSLYAEVFSFTGLARRILSEMGGSAKPYLDKGGRMLCMAQALDLVGPHLKVYSSTRKKARVQAVLLRTIDELKAACVSAETLRTAAENCDSVLRGKLQDLALILDTYEAVVANGHADPTDRLSLLAEKIPESSIGPSTRIYLDGFADFTGQEFAVLCALIETGAQVTVCLTMDQMFSENEIFRIPVRTASRLAAFAKEKGIVCTTVLQEEQGKREGISFFTDHMFSFADLHYEGEDLPVSLYTTESIADECEFAAAYCLKLVRDFDCRWRDIAVAVRGFDDYREILESCFAHYGVPLFTAGRSELMSRPLPALIAGVYDLSENGWEVDDLISYLHTGLIGLSPDDSDLLENYVYLWQLKGNDWKRESDWHQHPDGYSSEYTDEVNEKLERINFLRHAVAKPVLNFERNSRAAHTAYEHTAALTAYFEELRLPEILEERAARLEQQGRRELAAEYVQLWDIICNSVEQCAAILGETEMSMSEFGQLYMTVLSQYDIGTIPVSLDSVTAGDFDRMRRRNIRYLLALGATDSRIPQAPEDGGVLTEEDRLRLQELEVDLGGAGEDELWKEFNLIYNTMTLPSEQILFTRPMTNEEGAAENFALICRRAQAIFQVEEKAADMTDARLSAWDPALAIAADGVRTPTTAGRTAVAYFREHNPEKLDEVLSAASMDRGTLSAEAAKQLYGKKLRLSASKIDTLAACKFEYFCRYGLEAKRYEPIGFQPPEIGTFFHAVLEKTAKEVKAKGGWQNVTDDELTQMTDRYIEDYVQNAMDGLKEKSPRFIYLFRRMRDEVLQIVLDMAQELRCSDFEPMEFEFDFAHEENISPIELGNGIGSMMLTGIADRIDGWKDGNTLYIRVVDYKTGEKKFSLSDVWYGAGLQMLLYMYTLQDNAQRFGVEKIEPAGVMYVKAKAGTISGSPDMTDEKIQSERKKDLRRSGIVLNEEAVFQAWEHGEPTERVFIPFKFTKKNGPDKESIASAEQFGLMYRHIMRTLTEMAAELHAGNISADPLSVSETENACSKCDFPMACQFTDGANGECRRMKKKYTADEVWELMEREEAENDAGI